MEPATGKLQGDVECIVACEVLPWPDYRRPSNTVAYPALLEAARPPNPTPFKVLHRNSVRSILVKETNYVLVFEGILKARRPLGHPLGAARVESRSLAPGRFVKPLDGLSARV